MRPTWRWACLCIKNDNCLSFCILTYTQKFLVSDVYELVNYFVAIETCYSCESIQWPSEAIGSTDKFSTAECIAESFSKILLLTTVSDLDCIPDQYNGSVFVLVGAIQLF